MNFIRFAFTPTISLLLALFSLVLVMLLGLFFWLSMPVGFWISWTAYLVALAAFAIGNWISWSNYKEPDRIRDWKKGRIFFN
jgi:hypothetical protein